MCSLEKRGNHFILTLAGKDLEHRLNPESLRSIISALSHVKAQSSRGSALITVSHGKFFSNGFDLKWVEAGGSSYQHKRFEHLLEYLKQVVKALLSLTIPTIAAVNGHAAAAGLAFAFSHDYILMRRDRGVLYASDLDIGIVIPEPFMALFRAKLSPGSSRRNLLLRAVKIKGEKAMEMGIVDSVHDGEEAVREAAMEMGDELAQRNWDGQVYLETRKRLYPQLFSMMGLTSNVSATPKL